MVRSVGEWNFFVFCCHWRIVHRGEILADDDHPHARIEAAAQTVDGQKLTAFTLDATARHIVFSFDLGATLTMWPYKVSDDEQWSLYLPEERVLTYRADGQFSLSAAKARQEQEVWQAVMRSICIP